MHIIILVNKQYFLSLIHENNKGLDHGVLKKGANGLGNSTRNEKLKKRRDPALKSNCNVSKYRKEEPK